MKKRSSFLAEDKGKILVLSWHPGHKHVTAGGFVRNREVIKRLPEKGEFIVIDKFPSIYRDLLAECQIYEYHIPNALKQLETRFYHVERVLEWLLSMVLLVKLGLDMCRTQHVRVIYAPSSEILVVSVPAVILHLLKKKQLIFCNANVKVATRLTKMLLPISTFLNNRADYIISLSESLKFDQEKAGIKRPILVNTVGLDLEPFDRYLAVHSATPKVYDMILVARLVKEKGLYDLPKIFALVKEAGLNFKVVVVGEGSAKVKNEVIQQLEAYNLQDSVVFTGAASEEDKIKYYYQSKLCIFPSYVEGWGIVPQEAMAAGLAVVTYDLPVYQENIATCASVFRVELGDIKGFAEKVIALLSMSQEKLAELGSEGKDFVKKFDWNFIAQREYEIITQQGVYATIQ
jgi:glycosyltransferase involved in cell wall biosynthesis